MRTRTITVAFVAILGMAVSLNAQYVRLGDAGAITNSGVRPPTILRSVLALYTEDARTRGIEGTVTIEAIMGEDGRIKSMRVLGGLGFGLDEVALASVQEWEFSPATQDGVPVSAVAQVDVQFNLRRANAFRVGNGVTVPRVLSRVEPQYTQEAVRAKLGDGTVRLQTVIRNDGTVDIIRIIQGLPYGMTESAVSAVKQWKFSPGQKDGQDVDVALNIEINFNLAQKK